MLEDVPTFKALAAPPSRARPAAHCLRRAYEAARAAYARARALPDPVEALEATRRLNWFLGGVAVQEAEISLGRWKA